jgi:hypothetical protein
MTARAHEMKCAQVLKPESVTRRHSRACHFADAYGIEQTMNTSTAAHPVQWLFLDLNALFASCEQQEALPYAASPSSSCRR